VVDVPSNLVPTRISSLPELVGSSTLGWFPYVLSGVTYKAQMSQLALGSVSSVDASGGSTGLTFTGGPITSSGTLTLGGTLALASGGTGSTTAAGARAAILPSYATNANKALRVNAGATDVEWVTDAGGTVTSVGQTFTGGLISVSGSPVTGAGTLALTVAGTSGGIPYFSSASTWATSAALAANALVIGGGAGAAPATTTTGAGVITLLAGASSGTGGPAGTASPTLTGTPTLNDATLPYWILSRASTAKAYLGISDGSSILSGPAAGDTFFRNEGTLWIGAGGNTIAAKFASTLVTFPVGINSTAIGATTPSTGAFTTGAFSGVVTLTSNNGEPLRLNGATTGPNVVSLTNSGGQAYFGQENSTGNNIIVGSTGYDTIIRGPSGISFSANAGASLSARITSTGINSTNIGATTPGTGAFTTLSASSTSSHVGAASFGTASTTQGSLVLHNTSANSVTLKSSNSTSAAYTITLPVDDGTSGQVLSTDGSGVTSWTTAATQTSGNFATLPTLSSTGGGNSTTYTTQTAKSVVTGKAVIDNVVLVFATASGGSGSTQITNALSNAPSTDVSIAIGYFQAPSGISSTYQMLTMVVLAGTTTGLLYGYNLSLGTSGRITNTNMAVAGNAISYSAAYMIP